MRITVARRIYGGFITIIVLLLVISFSSYYNLNDIQTQTERVNQIAIPAVDGSNELKANFLNMGRLTFEAFFEQSLNGLSTKQQSFTNSKNTFNTELATLERVVADDNELRRALAAVKATFAEYDANVLAMYSNHKRELENRNSVQDRIGDLEDSADDASSYILDFGDLDEVQDNDDLARAADIGSDIEDNLLSLVTAAIDYSKT